MASTYLCEPSGERRDAHLGRFQGIYARNCEVRRIPKREAAEFLSLHHVLGSTSCRYAYGLYPLKGGYKGSLVAVSTFSGCRNIRFEGENPRTVRSYEWVRYASLPGVRVQGGMGKTLARFVEEVHPGDVMSYALVEKWKEGLPGEQPVGDAYRKLGFREEGRMSFAGGESVKFRLDLSDVK